MLRACPQLQVLAASRETLAVAGETVFLVPPLALPAEDDHPPFAELMSCEAVRLFIERARAALPQFELTAESAPALLQVCRRLDGLPLAIELAAPRVKMLAVEQLAARLDDCFRLLTAGSRTELPRHQTLRAAIDWSYDLLSEEERALLRRLSVFAGGWTLEAAEAVCAGEGIAAGEAFELLAHLVDKSLIAVGGQAQRRYRLLETVRHYARDRLREAGEAAELARRHTAFFLTLAEEIAPKINTAQRAARLAALDAEHDNLRAALRQAAEAEATDTELRLCGALFWFWLHKGYWSEGRAWLADALMRSAGEGRTRARATAMSGEGVLAWAMGDHSVARARLEESAAIFREVRDDLGLAQVLHFLASEMIGQDEYEQARPLAEESVALFRRHEADKFGLAVALASLGIVALGQEDYVTARARLEESIALCRALHDQWALALPLRNLGVAAFRQGDYDRAVAMLEQSLAVQRDEREKWFVSRSLESLAAATALRGDGLRAARLFGAGEALREAVGASVLPFYRSDYDRGVAAARAELGESKFREAWTAGRTLTVEQALAYALRQPPRAGDV